MVAFLAGLCVFLMIALMGAWATIEKKTNRIAELEALHKPATSPPWSVIRAREDADLDADTMPDLAPLGDLEGNDEPTKVCRLVP